MTKTKLTNHLTAAALAACIAALPLAAQKPAAKLKLPELKYETYKLPNGLQVITHEDHRLPLVAVDLWYHVGPLNERPGRTGFAHLFEHMMFEGSEHVGEKAHIKEVDAAGATGVNGTTDFDRTNYFETMPANQLELAMWLESDRMGFLMEGLDRTKLANQRDVVRNEKRQGEGRPYAAANDAVAHLLYPAGHPYYGDVIGSHADVEAARIADVRDFHQQFYTPNNSTIAIAGRLQAGRAEGAADEVFRADSLRAQGGRRHHRDAAHHRATPPDRDRHREAAHADRGMADAAGLHSRLLLGGRRRLRAGPGQGQPPGPGPCL